MGIEKNKIYFERQKMNIDELKFKTKSILHNNGIHQHEIDHKPTIIIYRNTNLSTGRHIANTGENALDGLIAVADVSDFVMCQARTIINNRYLNKIFADGVKDKNENFNKIAPCFRSYAWKRGTHRGKPAFQQNKMFPIIRTKDKTFGNDDDYVEFGNVSDNLHGWLASMGCCTVDGKMSNNDNKNTGDWKRLKEWGYKSYMSNRFDLVMLSHKDFINPTRKALRFGSQGENVKDLQKILGFFGRDIDGDFGFKTFEKLVNYQLDNNVEAEEIGIFEIS